MYLVRIEKRIVNKNERHKIEEMACKPVPECRALHFFLSFIEACNLAKVCEQCPQFLSPIFVQNFLFHSNQS